MTARVQCPAPEFRATAVVDEALRVIQALEFHEQHGEVCPANWRPGSATIKPNVADSREYFDHQARARSAGTREGIA